MAQYIPKSALAAEIERRKQVAFGWMETAPNDAIEAEFELCDDILSFIKSLEVKEVDLEKSISDWLFEGLPNDEELIDYIKETAKHFFELGLNTQYSSINIPNIDDLLEEEGIDPFSKEAKIFKESYYMALDKFKAQKGK